MSMILEFYGIGLNVKLHALVSEIYEFFMVLNE